MTKSEFVDQVADRAGLSKKDAGDAVDAVLETIENALKTSPYILNAAVGVSAGVEAFTSAFPSLYGDRVWLCLGVLAIITAANMWGVAESARLFIVPTLVFIFAIAVVIVGLGLSLIGDGLADLLRPGQS